jgi:aspartyl-tRNA(Asn)/glutamyl-tRNA(Gln) amidotransferase subunit A
VIDISAIEAANAELNAFVAFDEQASFGPGPLSGMTAGVKANIAVAIQRHSRRPGQSRDRTAARDAATVARLRDAGAAIVGMLNMEEAALGAKTDNPWFGATQNPHRAGYTPGGSSGGSGAAVAAGLCDVALGTDTMGSVRIPAAYCGVYGFKPSQARVSQDGLEILDADFDAIGPLARSLDTLEAAARAMSDVGEGAVAGLRTIADWRAVESDPALAALIDDALGVLGERPPVALSHPLSRIRYAGFVKAARSLAAHLADADPTLLSAMLRNLIGYGARRSDAAWDEDRAILADAQGALMRAVDDGSAIVLPTAPQAAFAHDRAPPASQADFTCLANVAGLPAISIPAGWSADGLPVGIQLIGKPGHEAGLFDAARTLDAHFAAYRPPPHFLKGAVR